MKKIDLVANFFEINAGISENKELMKFLVANLLNYIGQFSEAVKAHEFIMRPLTYGMIPDFYSFGSFSATHTRHVEKVGGYLGSERYYLDAVDIDKFYLFDKACFGDKIRKYLAQEVKTSEFAKNITLGFAAKPSVNKPKADDYPTTEPNISNH